MNTQRKVWSLPADWRLLLYNAAGVAGSPYFLLRKLRRQITGRSSKEFHMFNWACPLFNGKSQKNADAPHVVFVSGGLGEMHMTKQLESSLRQIHPNLNTTWAVRNSETALIAREKHPAQAVTAIPYDFLIPVWRWLRRLDPDIVVLVEKVWVPNIIWGSRRWGAKVVVVCDKVGGMRLSGIQGFCWRLVYRWTLRGASEICFQSSAGMDSMRELLSPDVPARVTGRVKLSQVRQPGDEGGALSASLSQWLSQRSSLPLLIAGSSKDIEEETMILRAFEIVRAQVPCALVIAPRRIHRMDEVLALLDEYGIKGVSRRSEYSEGRPPESSIEVYLLDTLGELSQTYAFAQAAYVGGTLRGPGHNVIEPLEWGVPVAFGPGEGEMTVEQQACREAGVGFCVSNAPELADFWLRVLQEEAWREELRNRAQSILQKQQQGLADTVAVISGMLNALPAR